MDGSVKLHNGLNQDGRIIQKTRQGSSVVEHSTHNAAVMGSSPIPATRRSKISGFANSDLLHLTSATPL